VNPLHVRLAMDAVVTGSDWTYALMVGPFSGDTLNITIPAGGTKAFDLEIQTGSTPGSIKAGLFGQNLDDEYGYGFSQGYFGIVPEGRILFVDDDGGEEFEEIYAAFFDSAGVEFTSMTEPDLLPLADAVDTSLFKSIFWNVSWGFPAVTPADITLLARYLDRGGNLFLAGQDIGWDVFDAGGNSYFPEAQAFYNTYLDARYVNDNSGVNSMVGVVGDPITDGLAFNITNVYDRYPEWVESFSGTSVPILTYTGSTKIGALRYDSGVHKAVYLGIGLEQMSDQSAAQAIVERTLDWFAEVVVSGDQGPGLPLRLRLSSCEPNPFSTETTFKYDVPRATQITLVVHDLAGRAVRTLVDGHLGAGTHVAQWDGFDVENQPAGAGVYVGTLQAGSERSSRLVVRIR
jgi:hypothetical protein